MKYLNIHFVKIIKIINSFKKFYEYEKLKIVNQK